MVEGADQVTLGAIRTPKEKDAEMLKRIQRIVDRERMSPDGEAKVCKDCGATFYTTDKRVKRCAACRNMPPKKEPEESEAESAPVPKEPLRLKDESQEDRRDGVIDPAEEVKMMPEVKYEIRPEAPAAKEESQTETERLQALVVDLIEIVVQLLREIGANR